MNLNGNDSPIWRWIRLGMEMDKLLKDANELAPENKPLISHLESVKGHISLINANGLAELQNRWKEPEKQYEPATDAEIKSNYERMAVAWEIIDGVTDFLTKHGYFHRKLDNELENHIKLEQMLNDNQKRNESKD